MHRHEFLKSLLFTFLFVVIFASSGWTEKIESYDNLYSRMAAGNPALTNTIKQMISETERNIQQKYANEHTIDIKFRGPFEYMEFGPRYISVSFEANELRMSHKVKIIFAILFEKQSSRKIEFSDAYLEWIGDKNIFNYRKLNEIKLCKLFQDTFGVFLCEKQGKQVIARESSADTKVDELALRFAQKANLKHNHNGSDINSGIIKERYIDSALTRDDELTTVLDQIEKFRLAQEAKKRQKLESTIEQLNAYTNQLEAKVAQMEKTVAQLSTILKGVIRKGDNLVFSGVNVYIVNGTGTTEGPVNGLGNLIVGYNESQESSRKNDHTGSHNIIVGTKHSYSSYGGLVIGTSNTISNKFSSVTGGRGNVASGAYSSVSGGHLNKAKGDYSSVSGGLNRSAQGDNSWAGGDKASIQ